MPITKVAASNSTLPQNTTNASRRIWRGERNGQHQRQGEGQEEELALGEDQGIGADALGGRRRGGERQHDAEGDDRQDGAQRPAVDGPPPLADHAAVVAGYLYHAALP